MLQDLDFALLENANEYVVHGLTVKVAVTALPLLACGLSIACLISVLHKGSLVNLLLKPLQCVK